MAGGELSGTDYLQGKPCPKCGHVRTAADTDPAWQCPSCHIAYESDSEATMLGAHHVVNWRELVRQARSDRSVHGLLAANLVALGIAVFTGMSLRELIFVYWMQNVMIGISYFVRILKLTKFSTHGLTIGDQAMNQTPGGKLMIALFFAAHYGFFHLVYFVSLVIESDPEGTILGPAPGLWGFLLCALTLGIGHAFSLRENLERDREATTNLQTMMVLPYVRVVPMHLMLILADFLLGDNAGESGSGFAAFFFFAALKIVADIASHVFEHHVLRTGRVLIGKPVDILKIF